MGSDSQSFAVFDAAVIRGDGWQEIEVVENQRRVLHRATVLVCDDLVLAQGEICAVGGFEDKARGRLIDDDGAFFFRVEDERGRIGKRQLSR